MTQDILLVDDDPDIRDALGQTIALAGLQPHLAGSFVAAKDQITPDFNGIIVTDIRMAGRDGFYLLDYVQKVDPELPVILLTGEADVPMAVRAMAAGAHDFLEKPCAPTDFLAAVRGALAARDLVLKARAHKLALDSGDAAKRMIFGQSKLADELRDRVRLVARAGAEVLITGDLGSGISKVAEVIHLLSQAAPHPFVKRAAAGLDAESLGSAFRAADHGTLFLDEVTGLPPAAQFSLLELLEQGSATRVIAGSTRDMDVAVADHGFHADLFYRLDLMRVRIPALRERAEDIPVLFHHYVAQACEQANLPVPTITPEVTARLMSQDWPGNARAVMNAAMRFAMGMGDGEAEAELGLAEQMARFEKTILTTALRNNQGRATETAAQLKLPRKTFYDKLAKHGLKPDDFRGS